MESTLRASLKQGHSPTVDKKRGWRHSGMETGGNCGKDGVVAGTCVAVDKNGGDAVTAPVSNISNISGSLTSAGSAPIDNAAASVLTSLVQ